MILDRGRGGPVERLSPTFVRVELGSPALADFGVDGPLCDQRIKLVFPDRAGRLPSFEGADESWFATWLEHPASRARPHAHLHGPRRPRHRGGDTRLVVDFVLHLEDGAVGPGSPGRPRATVGDRHRDARAAAGRRVRRHRVHPGPARRLLLVGDETAVPAVCSDPRATCPPTPAGTAFLEVPVAATCWTYARPAGVEVVWLPRDGAPLGLGLHDAVRRPPRRSRRAPRSR